MITSILICIFFSQSVDCKIDVEKAYDHIRKIGVSDALQMKYSVSMEEWDGGVTEELTSVVRKGQRVKMSTKDLEVFQDAEAMVAINREARSIFITKPQAANIRQDQFKAFTQAFDSLLNHVEMQSCELVCIDQKLNVNHRKVSFGLDQKWTGLTGIRKIVYWLTDGDPRIIRIQMEYSTSSKLKSLDFNLLEANSEYAGGPFDNLAVSHVLDKNGNLLPAYKNYELMDKRK